MMGSQFRSKSSSGHASVRAGFTGDNDRFEKVAHGRDPIPALVEMIRDYPRDALEFFGQSLYGKLSSSDRATVIDTRVLRALCNEVPKYDLDGAVRLERTDGGGVVSLSPSPAREAAISRIPAADLLFADNAVATNGPRAHGLMMPAGTRALVRSVPRPLSPSAAQPLLPRRARAACASSSSTGTVCSMLRQASVTDTP